MGQIEPRPSFAVTLTKALSIGVKKRGWLAFVPVRLICCAAVGVVISGFVPFAFWTDEKLSLSLAVYAGILAFNGILLAIGWSAFSKVYEIIGSVSFSSFLRRFNLLDIHIFFVDLMHGSLLVAAAVSFLGLVILPLNAPPLLDATFFAIMIALSFNSLFEAMKASAMMHDLLWDKSNYEAEHETLTVDRRLRAVGSGQA